MAPPTLVIGNKNYSSWSLRPWLPMNLRATFAWKFVNDEVDAGIRRIIEIWTQCREQHGGTGPWLFGEFTIADAMYAPVAWRFKSYGVPLEGEAARYLHTLLDMKEMRAWHDGALEETDVLPQCEARDIWPQ